VVEVLKKRVIAIDVPNKLKRFLKVIKKEEETEKTNYETY
jgi:hypothetical protein